MISKTGLLEDFYTGRGSFRQAPVQVNMFLPLINHGYLKVKKLLKNTSFLLPLI